MACGISLDQGWNPYHLHWQADSYPLYHQGSPQLLFHRSTKAFQWRKDCLVNKWCWNNWTFVCKKIKLDLSLTPESNINSKWILVLNVKYKIIKLLGKEKFLGFTRLWSSLTWHCQGESQKRILGVVVWDFTGSGGGGQAIHKRWKSKCLVNKCLLSHAQTVRLTNFNRLPCVPPCRLTSSYFSYLGW